MGYSYPRTYQQLTCEAGFAHTAVFIDTIHTYRIRSLCAASIISTLVYVDLTELAWKSSRALAGKISHIISACSSITAWTVFTFIMVELAVDALTVKSEY